MHKAFALLLDELELVAHLLRTSPRHPTNDGLFFRSSTTGVLQLLNGNGPQTVPQLARARRTSRQNMQLIVNRLLSAGHLEMRSNPAHKRSDLFELTETGQDLLARIAERENPFLEELARQISESEAGSVRAVMLRLREFLSERNGSRETPSRVPATKDRSHRVQTRDSVQAIGSTPVVASEIQSEENELPVSLL